jgi:hypothetical protein
MWFNYLNRENKNSLLSHLAADDNKFIVSREVVVSTTAPSSRQFAAFETFVHFYEYMILTPPAQRSFYEMITESRCVGIKPFFDIDIPSSGTEGLAGIAGIEMCCKQFAKCAALFTGVDTASGLVYTSYSRGIATGSAAASPPKKISFHVIIDGAKVNTIKEAEAFCLFAKEKFRQAQRRHDPSSETFLAGIDMSVYKTNQQFRMLGSKKVGSGPERTKILCPELSTEAPSQVSFFKQYCASLVTNCHNCEFIKREVFISFCPRPPAASVAQDEREIDTTEAQAVINSAKNEFLRKGLREFPFTLTKIQNSLIMLTRKRRSFCPICSREHENDNPFIKVFPDGSAGFYCRRNEARRFLPIPPAAALIDKKVAAPEEEAPQQVQRRKNPSFSSKTLLLEIL